MILPPELDANLEEMVVDWLDHAARCLLSAVCKKTRRMVCGSGNLVCVIQCEDVGSLQDYMKDHHERIEAEHMPKLEALLVDGKFKQQNFVYDDIE